MTDTPHSRRVAAVAAVVISGLCGVASAKSHFAGMALLAGELLLAGRLVTIARAGRRSMGELEQLASDTPADPESMPTITVLVPCHGEAAVVAALIADLGRQDHRDGHGGPRFEIIVIDDRSDDGTGEVARAAAEGAGIGSLTRVVRREAPERLRAAEATSRSGSGKAAALAAVPLDACVGDVILVLDADARLAPDFLRRAAAAFARGDEAVTARRRETSRRNGWFQRMLAGTQDDEQTVDGQLQLGRGALGGCSEFRGNGLLITREGLAGAGGWPVSALTEDLELATRWTVVSGRGVRWAPDLEVWEEPVYSFDALWRQRTRWAEGIVRRQLACSTLVLRSPSMSRPAKADFFAYGAQTLVPILGWGLLAGAARGGSRVRVLAAIAAYAGIVGTFSADALRLTAPGADPSSIAQRVMRAVRLLLFSGHWLLVFPIAWGRVMFGRGPSAWTSTPHGQTEQETRRS